MRDEALMRKMLERMAGDPLGLLPATNLTPEEDHACSLLEDLKLCEWWSNYPYGYRITASGYDRLAEAPDSNDF